MGEIEWGKCEICDNEGQLHRKYLTLNYPYIG